MINKDLLEIASRVKEQLTDEISVEIEYQDSDFHELIDECIVKELRDTYLTEEERKEISTYVFNSTRRFDFLQSFLDDDEISEIMINGEGNTFIEKGGKIIKINAEIITEDKLNKLIQNIVSKANRAINESNPIVDICLPDGSRANIVLKPPAINGPCITIRKFPKEAITMKKLIENHSITEEIAQILKTMVRDRKNILVAGGTSSGKTTMLNVLADCIPSIERVITIEDSAELQMSGVDNLVSLEVKNRNYGYDNEIDIRKLVKTALRMRPDRIIVGEVRDQAALDMIQALNTGHDGSMSTIHANSAEDALLRLETMALTAEVVPLDAVRRQIASAINVVIHLERDSVMRRKIKKIIEIKGVKDGSFVMEEIFCV